MAPSVDGILHANNGSGVRYRGRSGRSLSTGVNRKLGRLSPWLDVGRSLSEGGASRVGLCSNGAGGTARLAFGRSVSEACSSLGEESQGSLENRKCRVLRVSAELARIRPGPNLNSLLTTVEGTCDRGRLSERLFACAFVPANTGSRLGSIGCDPSGEKSFLMAGSVRAVGADLERRSFGDCPGALRYEAKGIRF
jgi:hypothetical protein